MARHELRATPKTVHWGYWDATLPPVLTVRSGDEVVVHTLSAQPPPDTHLPDDRRRVPPELLEIMGAVTPMLGPHILTGPIRVESAEPGDVLQVDVLDVTLRQDWGRNLIAPLKGTLTEDFLEPWRVILDLDLERRVLRWPKGVAVPLRPFFGVMGVAPAARYGRLSSILPLEHGGNMDNKELVAGATVYLPVWTPGALFSAGDGHAAQGDGEVDTTAVETALTGTFRLTVRKDLALALPHAETPTHYITMGFDPDLDDAVKTALREMIRHLVQTYGLAREEAYALCSIAVDLRISQVVNVYKGAHAMLPKSIFTTQPT
ncbi:MAG: acetamidase/formamidase family protein [Candidatus Rokuibacteriota bacterium]